ncbi:MAG: hypothetical protein LBK03_01175, partial [Bacteroidales bacterium]|nr:hypothetical protein [Bacteroidales bacterium]
MKKFYVTLVALVIAASGFAQEAVFPAMQVKKESQTFIPKAKKTLINQSKGVSGSYSLSYPEILGIILREYGTDPETGDTVLNFEYERKPIYCDSTARVVFYDSGTQTYDTGRVQFYGIGQIFAFGDKFWNDGSRNAGAYRWKVPDMTTATTFSVNSVSMECLYWRGTEVADSVVDTLVINVLSGLTEATLPYGTLTSDNQDWIGFPNIPYDINTLSVGVPAGAQLKVIKHPLTVTDTTLRDGSNLLRTFPVSGMTNLQAKNVVVFYTFKSGNT